MKILLLRHGKPKLENFGNIKSGQLQAWIEAYNESGIDESHNPSIDVIEEVAKCNYIVCSHLRRSIESAHALNVHDVHMTDLEFREMELPYSSNLPFKLSPMIWVSLFRMAWFLGYAKNCEPFKNEKQRARFCARKLINLANEYGSVAFIGHGLFNKYIVKELLANNWQGPSGPGTKYWSYAIYKGNTS